MENKFLFCYNQNIWVIIVKIWWEYDNEENVIRKDNMIRKEILNERNSNMEQAGYANKSIIHEIIPNNPALPCYE